jgi:hypothetical protein
MNPDPIGIALDRDRVAFVSLRHRWDLLGNL